MTPDTDSGHQQSAQRRRAPFWLCALGLPQYPGIFICFVSAALSHHLYDILRHADYADLPAEALEALIIGVVATAAGVALVRRWAADGEAALSRLSLILLPGLLFVFAPFRYAQVCRWTGWCQFWSDAFLVLALALCGLAALHVWRTEHRGGAWPARARIARLPASALYPLTLMLCLIVLAWRGHDRLVHPELFAEGGRQFVSDALAHGWWSLGRAYDGFYHTVPRLLALLATSLVPVAYIPAVTVAGCFAIAGAVCAFIARPAFRWLIPSDAARVTAALLGCLVPGLQEVFANLPDLHYLLFVVLALLLLKDPGLPYRNWELALAALVVASSGLVAAMAPVLAVRWWYRLRPAPGRAATPGATAREIALSAIILIPAMIKALLVLGGDAAGGGDQPSPTDGFDPLALLEAWGTVAVSMFLLHPFGGTVAVTEMVTVVSLSTLAVIAAAVFSGLFRALVRARGPRHAALVGAWVFTPFLLIALIAMFRHPALQMFLLDQDWHRFQWWMRYNYVFAVFGLIAWLLLLRPSGLMPGRSIRNTLAIVLCAAYISQANWYFDIQAYGTERRWQQSSAELERAVNTGCPRSVEVQIYPENWSFTYHTTTPNSGCGQVSD